MEQLDAHARSVSIRFEEEKKIFQSKKRQRPDSSHHRGDRYPLKLTVDGSGKSTIATGIPFFDHMLTLFAKHALFDLDVRAQG